MLVYVWRERESAFEEPTCNCDVVVHYPPFLAESLDYYNNVCTAPGKDSIKPFC